MSIVVKRTKTKKLPFNLENIDKYKTEKCILPWNRKDGDEDTNMLKHARCDEDTKGWFLVKNWNKDLIGYISWQDDTITSIEIVSKYQGRGYAKRLIKYALKDGCNKLTVNPKNVNAISFYKHLGYKLIGKKGNNIAMRISKKDIENIIQG